MKSKTKLMIAFFAILTAIALPTSASALPKSADTIAIKDTYIFELEHDEPHGTEANVRVGREPFGVFPLPIILVEYEGLFKFNLTFDPGMVENATGVKLILPITDSARTASTNKEMIFDVWEINDEWGENIPWDARGDITWDFQLENIIIPTDENVSTQFVVDITDHVDFRNINLSDNIFSVGVRRVDTYETYGYIDFGSRESASKPKIVLEYDDGTAKPWWQILWEFLISPFTFLFSILAAIFGFGIIHNKRMTKRIKQI